MSDYMLVIRKVAYPYTYEWELYYKGSSVNGFHFASSQYGCKWAARRLKRKHQKRLSSKEAEQRFEI